MREVVVVGRALGVRLPQDYAEQRFAFAATLPHAMTSSMHHDLEAGRPLEVEWLAGAVVTLGASRGIPAPLCRAVWDVLALHAAGR
jgi:2-dehydropantoate 2-reductase